MRRLRQPRRRGRPTSLTPVRVGRLVEAVSAGNHITVACAAAGVSRATLYRWLCLADAAEQTLNDGGVLGSRELELLDFRDRLTLARARAEISAVSIVVQAMTGGTVISEKPVLGPAGETRCVELWGDALRAQVRPARRLARAEVFGEIAPRSLGTRCCSRRQRCPPAGSGCGRTQRFGPDQGAFRRAAGVHFARQRHGRQLGGDRD